MAPVGPCVHFSWARLYRTAYACGTRIRIYGVACRLQSAVSAIAVEREPLALRAPLKTIGTIRQFIDLFDYSICSWWKIIDCS